MALVGEGRALRAVVRALKTGRSGLIAASLVGAATVLGCSDGSTGTAATGGDSASTEDTAVTEDVLADTAPDTPALPPYGIPPEDIREPADATTDTAPVADAAPDIPLAPPYGIPPEPDAR